jgi:hypothetical protein
MAKVLLLSVIIAGFVLLFICCERDGDCKEVITIPFSYLKDFGGDEECGLDFSTADPDSNYLISNESAYDELIDCRDSIIDFREYSLLAGSHNFDTSVVIKNQAAIRNCKDRTFTFRISFQVTDTVETRFYQYHAVIPKIPDDYLFSFEIEIWQDY